MRATHACVRVGGWSRVELWVGNNIIRSSSFFSIAVSHTANTHYFTCKYTMLVAIVISYLLEHFTFDIFSHLTLRRREDCKAQ